MDSGEKFFIEIECSMLGAKGEKGPSTHYLRNRAGLKDIVTLASGYGQGVGTNVTAGVVASMAMNYTLSDGNPLRGAGTIIRTFEGGAPEAEAKKIAFTIMELHHGDSTRIVEYSNPGCIRFNGSTEVESNRREASEINPGLFSCKFKAQHEERLVVINRGIAEAGKGTRRMPEGWGVEGVSAYCSGLIIDDPTISASEMSRRVVTQGELNDLFAPKNDMACVVVYFRRPRRILIVSGPPFKESKDVILADMVDHYKGSKLICGGTTAQIVSRELKREIVVDLRRDPAGLPPTSKMDGVDLITEGVLTLNKVKRLLEGHRGGGDIKEKGTDGIVAKMLLEHDIVEFVVGTRINPIHQDPTLPVELELRRNIIKELGRTLEEKYMKEVKIQYM